MKENCGTVSAPKSMQLVMQLVMSRVCEHAEANNMVHLLGLLSWLGGEGMQ